MEVRIIGVGSLKENYLEMMQNDYLKRIRPYCPIEVIEVKEENYSGTLNQSLIKIILEKEGENCLKKIAANEYVILLDLHGKKLDSIQFAGLIDKQMTNGNSKFTFVIGGSYGVGENLKKRANFALCLSTLTFTHQITRVLILEQIYRAFKINRNEIYHK